MIFLKNRILAAISIIIFILPGLYLTQFRIDSYKSDFKTTEDFDITLPSDVLKAVSLNQEALIADILWLKVIQYIGEKKQSEKGWEWFYHNINVITDLDPNFYLAYQFSGLILAVFADKPDQSITILKKGVKNNPDNWFMYFLLGYNYFNEVKDYKKAAFYIKQASLIDGSPSFLKFFATSLYSSAGDPEDGIIFTESLLKQATDEEMKNSLLQRLKMLYIERDLNLLNSKVTEYNNIYKKSPSSINDLVKADLLNTIPLDPFGKEYYFDKIAGVIKSPSTEERLKVFRRH